MRGGARILLWVCFSLSCKPGQGPSTEVSSKAWWYKTIQSWSGQQTEASQRSPAKLRSISSDRQGATSKQVESGSQPTFSVSCAGGLAPPIPPGMSIDVEFCRRPAPIEVTARARPSAIGYTDRAGCDVRSRLGPCGGGCQARTTCMRRPGLQKKWHRDRAVI